MPAQEIRAYRSSFVGMGLLACVLFLVLGAASAYGAWVTVVLVAFWLVLFALGCRWFASRPAGVVAAGVVALLVWAVAAVLANL